MFDSGGGIYSRIDSLRESVKGKIIVYASYASAVSIPRAKQTKCAVVDPKFSGATCSMLNKSSIVLLISCW